MTKTAWDDLLRRVEWLESRFGDLPILLTCSKGHTWVPRANCYAAPCPVCGTWADKPSGE